MVAVTEVFHQALAVMTITLNELHYGVGDSWLAPTIEKLQNTGHTMRFSEEDSSWIASIEHLGKVVGCFLPAFFLDVVGRRTIITCCALTYFVVWLGITITSSVIVIIWMRLLFGIACGANNATNTIYLAEVTSPMIRGIFGTIILSIYDFGVLSEYAAASYLPYRITAIINTVLGVLTILSVFWLVESVQYLLLKGRHQQAERNFVWLKGVTELAPVKGEFEKIKVNVEYEKTKKNSFRQIFSSQANYRSVMIVAVVYSLADSSGYTAILSYSSIAFSSTDVFSKNNFTILLGFIQFVMSILALFFINLYGRRPLLIVSFLLLTLVQMCSAILYYVNENLAVNVPYFPWLIFFTITLYFSVFALVSPAIFAIRGELFPLSIKAYGGCIVVVVNSCFLMTKIFLHVNKQYGMYANFAMYAVTSLCLVIFIFFCLPETRNKTLTEIQEELREEEVTNKMLPD